MNPHIGQPVSPFLLWLPDLLLKGPGASRKQNRERERKRQAKKGLSKANTVEAFNNLWRVVNISLATVFLLNKVLDALASAVTAPDAELERGTTIVTFNLHSKTPDSSDCHQPRVLSKGEQKRGCFSWVHFQANYSSNMLKETTPRTGFRGGGGGWDCKLKFKRLAPAGPCFAI